jgi:hypothetical protein
VTIELTVGTAATSQTFDRERVIHIGRDRANDVVLGRERVLGRATVSRVHARLVWDGARWSTWNESDKAGLLRVYEPGFEELSLVPGRPWSPERHRWCLSFGRPDHPFHVVCRTDDHGGPRAGRPIVDDGVRTVEPDSDVVEEDEPTAALDPTIAVPFTALETGALLAYYGDFVVLPRPAVLSPRSHDDAALRLGRTKDSTRKAIERANEKIGHIVGAPAIASGRNVSEEIGRWLARNGLLDADDPTPARAPEFGPGR